MTDESEMALREGRARGGVGARAGSGGRGVEGVGVEEVEEGAHVGQRVRGARGV